MTLTVRSATVSGATTKGSALTHAELDENFNHLSQASNHTFTPSGNGAVSRTVSGRLSDAVHVFDFIPVAEHAAIVAGTSTTNVSTYIQAAIDTGKNIVFQAGSYKAAGLTQSTADQCFVCANGIARIIKNANGTLFASTGARVICQNISWRGDASSPTFTGDGATFTGADVILINCGSRWMSGRALKSTGNHTQIYGTCDIYQTTGSGATDWDIELGVSGTATLYHELHGIYSSQSTGGILAIDVGGLTIVGGQYGKLHIDAGTSPAGVGSNKIHGSRINGDITVDISSATFTGNAIDAVTVTLAAGTSGHSLDGSNVIASGATITDNSSSSYVVDIRITVPTSYTPSWTATITDPAIENGTITGRYSKHGRWVDVAVQITMGASTTYGSGPWRISLPFVPSTTLPYVGTLSMFDSGTEFRTGAVETLTDGTARCTLVADSGGDSVKSSVPFTWASGDRLRFSLRYAT
jgi:hypothetical protein